MVFSVNRGKNSVQSVRLDPTQHEALLSWLEEEALVDEQIIKKRKHLRFPFNQGVELVILVRHPGGGMGSFQVVSYDLSKGGVGFLHARYLHPGTSCLVIMTTLDDRRIKVPGSVVRCQHVRGQIHSMGVAFDKPIDINHFIECPKTDGGGTVPQDTETKE